MAKRKGLDIIAITDHNNMNVYKKFPSKLDIIVVRGMEIKTDMEDVTGLFYVDLVEVINARSGSLDNANAWQVCEKFDKNPITGFDSIERMIPSMAQRTSL